MPELPPLTIVVTTWLPPADGGARFAVMKQARRSWSNNLIYEDGDTAGTIDYVIGDDGSPRDTLPQIAEVYRSFSRSTITMLPGSREGVGASLNRCVREISDWGRELALYMVDDWALSNTLDITPWVKLLLQDESIGAVRLGPPHPDLTGRVMHLGELGWALALDRHHYAFSFRPTLFHKRFFEAYGPFEEGVSALECERQYNERFCRWQVMSHSPPAKYGEVVGPDIVLALPSPFSHLYSVELSAIVPEGASA